MDKAKPKSWKRDLARAVLLAVLLVGLPAAGMAAAHYRKHIQACYWAWKWARTEQPSFDLTDKLYDIEPPYSAAKVAHRLAYRWAPDEKRKLRAAWNVASHFGLRELYTLATVDGDDSPAAKTLREALTEVVKRGGLFLPGGFDPAVARKEGFTNANGNWYPPENNAKDVSSLLLPLRIDFGSYRVHGHVAWERVGHERHWARVMCAESSVVKRLPGPWRDLPAALKPEPAKFECHYDRL